MADQTPASPPSTYNDQMAALRAKVEGAELRARDAEARLRSAQAELKLLELSTQLESAKSKKK